jgi:hypothetical protein
MGQTVPECDCAECCPLDNEDEKENEPSRARCIEEIADHYVVGSGEVRKRGRSWLERWLDEREEVTESIAWLDDEVKAIRTKKPGLHPSLLPRVDYLQGTLAHLHRLEAECGITNKLVSEWDSLQQRVYDAADQIAPHR